MAIEINHMSSAKAHQLTFKLFELLIPLIGKCLGDKLDDCLSEFKTIENDPTQLEIRKEAINIIRDLLPALRAQIKK